MLAPDKTPLDFMACAADTPTMQAQIISISPDVMGGTPVFAGTRVPIQTLLDYLEGGESIEDFLEGFPTVSREQVVAFLEASKEAMLSQLNYDEAAA
jgi:uncharacterized protein (DUF433 family)